jgi:competence protein ComEA
MLKRVIPSTQWAAITLVAAFIFALLLIRAWESRHPQAPPSPAPIIVEVQGDVLRPGVHILSGPTGTVSDALSAAGWSPTRPDLTIPQDLAQRAVETGKRIHVSHKANAPPDVTVENMDAAARLTLGSRLDLNLASEGELLLVPRMKPDWAKAIVERRRQLPWKTIDDLQEISGIGPKTVEKWRKLLDAQPPSQ